MKTLLIFMPLFLMACATHSLPKTQPSATATASIDSCEKVYERLLAISLTQLNPDQAYSKAEREAAVMLLDKQYNSSGTTQKFFAHCVGHMTNEQVLCMQKAESFNQMSTCQELLTK
jgi:hypothetical protein